MNDVADTLCSKTLDTLKKNGLAEGVVEFHSGKEITDMFEMIDGQMEDSVGYYNPASVVHNLRVLMQGMGECSPSNLPRRLRRTSQRSPLPFRRSRTRHIPP